MYIFFFWMGFYVYFLNIYFMYFNFCSFLCWFEYMLLDNEIGLDFFGMSMSFVFGFVVVDYFMVGYFVWVVLIVNLVRIGYEEKNMYMVAYDWSLFF